MDIVEKIKRQRFISAYRKVNHQNETFPGNMFDIRDVTIGKKTYGTIRIFNDVKNAHLYIGSFCSIGDNVVFLLGIDYPTNFISTFPFRVKIEKKDEMEAISKGNIVVDDDVWIGYGATILSGVHIGQGAIVGANALVTKDIPPYAIAGGTPAKLIKYRFEERIINELLKVDFDSLTDDMIIDNIDDLYKEMTDISQISWMPKK